MGPLEVSWGSLGASWGPRVHVGVYFWSILGSFVDPFGGPFYVYVGSILGFFLSLFWVHVGSIFWSILKSILDIF